MSYCIRNAKGEYLTHSVDVVKGKSTVWFTPSAWLAYCMNAFRVGGRK